MNTKKLFQKFIGYRPAQTDLPFKITKETDKPIYDVREDKPPEPTPKVFSEIEANMNYIKVRFDVPKNKDVVLRAICLNGGTKAFIVSYDGMCDGTSINDGVIKALLALPVFNGIDKR